MGGGGHQTPPDGGQPGHPLGGWCPVRLSSWYVFFADICPPRVSALSEPSYYMGLDKKRVRSICPRCPPFRIEGITSVGQADSAICPPASTILPPQL
jgi:hypothetical protein